MKGRSFAAFDSEVRILGGIYGCHECSDVPQHEKRAYREQLPASAFRRVARALT
jgi:hypothetical protein